MVLGVRALGAAFQPGARGVVHLEETRLAASLDGHVGNGQAPLNGEVADGRAGKLHGAVERTVHADLTDHVEDDVLCAGASGQLAVNLEADGLGHLEPRTTGRHAHASVRGANARGERTDATIGAGVRIRANDQVARAHNAALGEKGMLNAHAALLEVVCDAPSRAQSRA